MSTIVPAAARTDWDATDKRALVEVYMLLLALARGHYQTGRRGENAGGGEFGDLTPPASDSTSQEKGESSVIL